MLRSKAPHITVSDDEITFMYQSDLTLTSTGIEILIRVADADDSKTLLYVLIVIFSAFGLFTVVVAVYAIRCWIARCRARNALYEERVKLTQNIQNILKNSPEFKYHPQQSGKYKQTDCPICLYSFEQGNPVRMLECGHIFHADCILEWVKIREKATCPICNVHLTGKPVPANSQNVDRMALRSGSGDWT